MRRAANVWDRFYRLHEAPWRGETPVAHLLPLLGGGRVLELGTGNGKTLRPLVAAGVDAVGLDVSFHALRRLGHDRLVLADARRLPFVDGAFATVLDIHCTGHLRAAGRKEAMAECARVLQPQGHLVVERLGPDDLRAGQGEPVEAEPGMRHVQDGRETQFSAAPDIVAEAQPWFEPVQAEVERRQPGHRGSLVVRESVRVLLRRVSS